MKIVANDLSIEQFHQLRDGCCLKPLEPRLVEKAMKHSLLTLCAEEDGKSVGMLRLVGDGALVVVLCDVMVLPEYRRRGIGGAMIDAALDWVARDMPEGKWVSVMLTCTGERKDYYKKFGFRALDDCAQGCAMQAFIKGIDTGAQRV